MNVVAALFIFILLPLSLPAHARSVKKNTCGEIRGTFECGSPKNLSIIEFRGDQITVIDDSDIPLNFQLNRSQPTETASEKLHVTYTSKCDKGEVKISKTILHKDGSGTGVETTTFSFGERDDLRTRSISKGPTSYSVTGATCIRIETDR